MRMYHGDSKGLIYWHLLTQIHYCEISMKFVDGEKLLYVVVLRACLMNDE